MKPRPTTRGPAKPNQLLYAFIILSLGVHAFIPGRIAGLYNSDANSHIELEMRAEKPTERSIPLPPQRRRIKPLPDTAAPQPMTPLVVEKPAAPSAAPRITVAKPSIVEPIAVSRKPVVSDFETLAWTEVKQSSGMETASRSASSVYGSARDYFSMVRMAIESRKQYPSAARRRQIQGRVVVRFVIESNGTVNEVSLVKASPHPLLDEAALAAVKACSPFPPPPARFFSGPVPFEICIVFELM